jgi:hypothetical protein
MEKPRPPNGTGAGAYMVDDVGALLAWAAAVPALAWPVAMDGVRSLWLPGRALSLSAAGSVGFCGRGWI